MLLLLFYYYYYYILFQATLGQRLWLIMNNIPDNVANAPASVVTALRIVQREEKLVIDIKNCNFYNNHNNRVDHYIDDSLRERNIPVSLIPNRPKKWREKCVQIMESSIMNKFTDMKPYNVEESKEWLDEHLTEVASVSYQVSIACYHN